MKKLRASAARALRAARSALAAGPVSARFPASREQRHTLVVWLEDHAEPLILTTLTALVTVISVLLLWKTARIISLASEFQPVLGVIAALTTLSLAALNLLKGRRDRRLKGSGTRQIPAEAVTSTAEEQKPAAVAVPDEGWPAREGTADSSA